MSLLIKSLVCASLFYFSSLSGSDFRLETNVEGINFFPVKNPVSQSLKFVANDLGELAWIDRSPAYVHLFYWSEETDTVEIKIDEALRQAGIDRRDAAMGVWPYPINLDNFGNVFINIDCRSNTILLPSGRNSESRIGVWNKKFGFKLLYIPGIVHVSKCQPSGDKIFVYGQDASREEQFVVLRSIEGRWPWEPMPEVIEEPVKQPLEATPWDALPFGKHSSRLHILQQLLRNTKNASEKKIILVIVEAEMASMFDLLQYDIKSAQSLISKAKSEQAENPDAEALLAESKKHMSALLAYFKTLPKVSKSRIDSLHLPSKDWLP